MIIYFDTCCLQRPLDDRSQPRINIEAEAILTILGLIENGYGTFITSEVLANEISRIPDDNRRIKVEEIINLAKKNITLNGDIEMLAKNIMKSGIKAMDALHLASAINYHVDYFCTSDDNFLKKAKNIESSNVIVTSPLELLTEILK